MMLESPACSTVEELAKRAHMSRASFAQLFREVSNSTPLAVLTALRLQFAAQMLSRGTQPLIVIAESVGYASESSFHKVFYGIWLHAGRVPQTRESVGGITQRLLRQ